MKTCKYNIQRFFSAVKIEKNIDNFNILLRTLTVGTH